ncbi:MAG TPA: ABC transporter permease [Bacteroidia bacterium]|nr:ABC transporter permease [Bacteroidia bacterium]HNS13264.1 ABC transporter permease [Bacteroidia bacterium]
MTKFSKPSKFLALVFTLAMKTLKLRYKNSIFGFLWSMINPIIYLVIFTFVFGNVFSEIDRYPLYALTGLVFWIFFSTSTIQVIESIINSSGVLKSINIPTIAFPLSAQLAALISLFLSMIPFMILMFIFGLRLTWESLIFFPVLVLFTAFTFGVSLILTSFNVYFRDMQLAWGSFMPAIFYATPIAYTASLIPAKFIWVLKLNPLYHFIGALRHAFYYNTLPSLGEAGILLVVGLGPLAIGYWVFNRLEKGFVSQY